jgi:glycerophosphoryl diester phosphodiesterase
VLIELKTPPCQEGPLEARAAELVGAYGGPAAVLSFNADALAAIGRSHAGVARGLNLSESISPDQLAAIGPDFLSIDKALAGHSDVADWRTQGKPAIAWTVRSPAEQWELDGRVDNIVFEGYRP